MGKTAVLAFVAPLAALLSVVALAALPAFPALPTLGPRQTGAPGVRPIGTVLHGDWVLSVSERDGRPVSRTEFSNDLTPEGQAALVDLLDGTHYLDRWAVHLEGLCPGRQCGPEEGRGLMVDSAGGRITLTGDFDRRFGDGPDVDTRITQVATWLHTCTITELWLSAVRTVRFPIVCDQPAFDDDSERWVFLERRSGPFTSANLSPPVEVSRGQRVSVRVTFTLAEAGR